MISIWAIREKPAVEQCETLSTKFTNVNNLLKPRTMRKCLISFSLDWGGGWVGGDWGLEQGMYNLLCLTSHYGMQTGAEFL